jgi:hypothetical protein
LHNLTRQILGTERPGSRHLLLVLEHLAKGIEAALQDRHRLDDDADEFNPQNPAG